MISNPQYSILKRIRYATIMLPDQEMSEPGQWLVDDEAMENEHVQAVLSAGLASAEAMWGHHVLTLTPAGWTAMQERDNA